MRKFRLKRFVIKGSNHFQKSESTQSRFYRLGTGWARIVRKYVRIVRTCPDTPKLRPDTPDQVVGRL